MGGVAMGGERAILPLGERKDDYTFWRKLIIRCGYKEHWPWESMKELAAYRLEPLGMSWEEFVQAGAVLGLPPKEKHSMKSWVLPPHRASLSCLPPFWKSSVMTRYLFMKNRRRALSAHQRCIQSIRLY